MSAPSTLKVGRTRAGYCIRVEDRGTLRESPAVQEFVIQALGDENCSVVIDLKSCDYLDSTFLGCLLVLHRRYGLGEPPRFVIAAPPEVSLRLLAPTRLDGFLTVVGESPEIIGEELVLSPLALDRNDFGRHVLECHRRLSDIGGPNQAAFERIVDQLERELVSR